MLSISQKESILRKASVAIPRFPTRRPPPPQRFDDDGSRYAEAERTADDELKQAVARWKEDIESLYETHIRRRVEATIQTVKSHAIGDRGG
jgi:hypothetical protein